MHILYVDESGDDGFSPTNEYNSNTQSKVFLRTGIALHDHQWRKINRTITELRYNYRIPPQIEIHATEIWRGEKRIYKNKQKVLIPNWYGSTFPDKTDRQNILRAVCRLIASLPEISIMCAIVDKTKVVQPIISSKLLPKNITWELLIERYNLYLKKQPDKSGIIISDAVQDSIEKKQRDFAREIYCTSPHVQDCHFIESILFEPSDSSNMLQLADVASYAIFKKFNTGSSELYDIIQPRILKNDAGSIDGAGLKIWPPEDPCGKPAHPDATAGA
ncbi:MAG: DUF3800 domain-containing protein [Treponema sp.]|nr:DUF3800 domain-containing protein [Treponema sp.]